MKYSLLALILFSLFSLAYSQEIVLSSQTFYVVPVGAEISVAPSGVLRMSWPMSSGDYVQGYSAQDFSGSKTVVDSALQKCFQRWPNCRQYSNLFLKYQTSTFNAVFLCEQAGQESGGCRDDVVYGRTLSRAGAGGILQFMPATWNSRCSGNKFNPDDNVKCAVNYLEHIYTNFAVKTSCPGLTMQQIALGGYNAGENKIPNCGIQRFRETNDYMKKIWQRYSQDMWASQTQIS